ASQHCWRILRLGMRILLLADARFTMYGECTYTGSGDARNASASSRGTGFFQLCGSDRNICTRSAPVTSATPSGSSVLTWAPICIAAEPTQAPPASRFVTWMGPILTGLG